MIKIIKNAFWNYIERLPKKYILFESKPDYTDNSFALYEYIKKNKVLPKYKMIWVTNDKKNVCNKKIKTIFKGVQGIDHTIRKYYTKRTKLYVSCNEPFEKWYDNQVSLFLCHGSKSKKTRGIYEMPPDLDYILVQADMFKEALKYEYNLSEHTKMITLGYPRNDDLLLENSFDKQKLFDLEFKKMIVWYPTFRQHKSSDRSISSITIPFLHDEKDAEKLNEKAKEQSVLILIKPHPAQDMSFIKNRNLSNIKIITEDFLKEKKIRSYQLLKLSDALLTDYSSVYYDYLLTDKPIGLTWEDYNEYKEKQGFVLDENIVYAGGEKIFTIEDFYKFITRIANGEDLLKKERDKMKKMSNVYLDAESSKRVAEFIKTLVDEK